MHGIQFSHYICGHKVGSKCVKSLAPLSHVQNGVFSWLVKALFSCFLLFVMVNLFAHLHWTILTGFLAKIGWRDLLRICRCGL